MIMSHRLSAVTYSKLPNLVKTFDRHCLEKLNTRKILSFIDGQAKIILN